ncbi:MAG: RagB/SusD family nutrient uptake outer membrane protein [Chitinophagaceae bacterium]
MKKIFKYYPVLLLLLLVTSCKKDYLETNPSDQAPTALVFSTTEGAYVALNGLYRAQYTAYGDGHDGFAQKANDLVADLMGNDMVVNSAGYGWFTPEYQYTEQTSAVDGSRSDLLWSYYYFIISTANNIIASIDQASGPQADKDNIKGQALGVRAYSYFYLVNFLQHTYKGSENKPGVPIYTTPTSEGNPRGTVQADYTQIIKDLTDAEALLTNKPRKHISHMNVNTGAGYQGKGGFANGRLGYCPQRTLIKQDRVILP